MTATIDEDDLSETFSALANSTRRALLKRLAAGEADRMDDRFSELQSQKNDHGH